MAKGAGGWGMGSLIDASLFRPLGAPISNPCAEVTLVQDDPMLAMAEAVGDVVRDDDGRRYRVHARESGVMELEDVGDPTPLRLSTDLLSAEDMIEWTMRADEDRRLWDRIMGEICPPAPVIHEPEPSITTIVAPPSSLKTDLATTPVYPPRTEVTNMFMGVDFADNNFITAKLQDIIYDRLSLLGRAL